MSASFCIVGMLIRPPYGDQAASPVSSYSTSSTLGAPSGAGGSRNGVQSATESRTSRLTTPLNFLAIPSSSTSWMTRPRVAPRRRSRPHPVRVRLRPAAAWLGVASDRAATTPTGRAAWLLPTLSGYDRRWLRFDVVAGLAAGTVVIPQAMAYATIAGLPVEIGLYTCMLPMIVYALLGGSRSLSISTTSTIAILTASALAALPGGPVRRTSCCATPSP